MTDRSDELIRQLTDARERELTLFSDLGPDLMLGTRAHFLEPPIWELGHVGWFQEWWILRHLAGADPLLPRGDSMYDSFNVSYTKRWDHEFPSRDETLRYVREVLDRCVDRLGAGEPTERDVYFTRLAALHEDMHAENLMMIRQTLGTTAPPMPESPPPKPEAGFTLHDVEAPGGTFLLGADRDEPFVFDNEKWAHEVTLAPFRISATPVTNGQFRDFVEDGGYRTPRFWGKSGWEWRRREGATHPLFWRPGSSRGEWLIKRFDALEPLDPWEPVVHVNWCEARAWCAWAGRRLPTEAEWEYAASVDPATGRKRRYPWGDEPPTPERSHLDSMSLRCVDVRAFPSGDSAIGCRQMIGNVWEWVDDTLQPYPGFECDPYESYSKPYFGVKKILRGGAWTTRSRLIRNTWRNFFMRHRRNVCAGFRTVAAGAGNTKFEFRNPK